MAVYTVGFLFSDSLVGHILRAEIFYLELNFLFNFCLLFSVYLLCRVYYTQTNRTRSEFIVKILFLINVKTMKNVGI